MTTTTTTDTKKTQQRLQQLQQAIAQSAGAVEYTDCASAEW